MIRRRRKPHEMRKLKKRREQALKDHERRAKRGNAPRIGCPEGKGFKALDAAREAREARRQLIEKQAVQAPERKEVEG